MTTLAESAQALWDLLDRDGFDTNVVLILADCLEEQGSPDRLWEGLRAMVRDGHQPYYSDHYRKYWWLDGTSSWVKARYTTGVVPCPLFNKIKNPLNDFLIEFEQLSCALLAYARAWVSLYGS